MSNIWLFTSLPIPLHLKKSQAIHPTFFFYINFQKFLCSKISYGNFIIFISYFWIICNLHNINLSMYGHDIIFHRLFFFFPSYKFYIFPIRTISTLFYICGRNWVQSFWRGGILFLFHFQRRYIFNTGNYWYFMHSFK